MFIGPPPDRDRRDGLEVGGEGDHGQAQVPLVPGYHGDDQDPALLAREAAKIGYPGADQGDRGRRRQGHEDRRRAPSEFAAALASAQREAKASFGDDRVLHRDAT